MERPKILGREPVLWLSLLRAVVVLGLAFGWNLSQEQTAALYLFMEGALSLIARSQVTPVGGEH